MQNMPMTFRSQVPDINSQNYLPYISYNFSSENVTSENIPRKIFLYSHHPPARKYIEIMRRI